MTDTTLSGIVAYTVTPFFDESDTINLDALFQLIDKLIDSGADAIATLGSAGEGAYLSDDEWTLVASETIRHVNSRQKVVVGISELTTKKAIERAMFASDIGADMVMVSPFSYYPLTDDEIYDHYAAISAAISIPIMIYNNPATCGVDMSPELMISMVEGIEHASMIKESTGDIQRMRKIQRLSKGTVPFFNGCNYIALDALNAGAVGWCTAAPCLIDTLPKQLLTAVKNGEKEKAKTLFDQQFPLLEFIVNGGLASTVKAGLEIKGLHVGTARRPLKPLTVERKEILNNLLKTIK